MTRLHQLVTQAVGNGLIKTECYSATRAVEAQELAQANEEADKERTELIKAIIAICDNAHWLDDDKGRFRNKDNFWNAISKADSLVDSIPHNITRTT